MAPWGGQTTREDDPERAIRAALAMQSELDAFGEFSAIGDTVNLASRLEHAAPVGGERAE